MYVALSRVTNIQGLHILLEHVNMKSQQEMLFTQKYSFHFDLTKVRLFVINTIDIFTMLSFQAPPYRPRHSNIQYFLHHFFIQLFHTSPLSLSSK